MLRGSPWIAVAKPPKPRRGSAQAVIADPLPRANRKTPRQRPLPGAADL